MYFQRPLGGIRGREMKETHGLPTFQIFFSVQNFKGKGEFSGGHDKVKETQEIFQMVGGCHPSCSSKDFLDPFPFTLLSQEPFCIA